MGNAVDYRKPENWGGQLKAIRAKCLDCQCGSEKGVRECSIFGCSLWPFRFGVRPETAGDKLYQGEDAGEEAGNLPLLAHEPHVDCVSAMEDGPGKGEVPPRTETGLHGPLIEPEGKVLKDIPRKPVRIESTGTSA